MAKQAHYNRRSQQDKSGRGKVKNVPNDPSLGGGKAQQQKHEEIRQAKYFNIQAKTSNQAKLMEFQKRCALVISSGSSGTGKTFVACVHAANQLTTGKTKQIVLTRPPEGVGATIGFRKGTVEEKLSGPYQSMVEPLKQVLGESTYNMYVKQGYIILEPLEDVRGRSYRDSTIIVDEASNTDIKSMQTLVTRVGSGSQIILCGDTASWQKDIKGESGLEWIIDMVKKLRKDEPTFLDQEDWDNLYNNIGLVEFTKHDVVRSGITKLFVKAFDEVCK